LPPRNGAVPVASFERDECGSIKDMLLGARSSTLFGGLGVGGHCTIFEMMEKGGYPPLGVL
jgi:hypothetical protein